MKVLTMYSVVLIVESTSSDRAETAPCNNRHLFQPLLRGRAAVLAPDQIGLPIRTVLRGRRNTAVLLVELPHSKK